MTARGTRARIGLCAGLMGLALAGLGTRLAFLHVGSHEDELERIRRTRQWSSKIDVERGKIFDRRGEQNILALDLPVKDLCVDPQTIASSGMVATVAARLSEQLGEPVDSLAATLNQPGRRYACLRRGLQTEEADRIGMQRLPGVFFEEQTIRFYPHHDFLCHVLGFVNMEKTGSAGVELRMDKFLRGCPGIVEGEKNALRQEMYWKRERYVEGVQGASVHLTIDQYVQFIVEKALDSISDGQQGLTWKRAWAVVENVRTGEILAMASRPSFDLNEFRDANDEAKLNAALGVVYEPGSTLKAITFSAALNEGIVTQDTVFDCENGSWSYGGRVLHDYHPAGRLTVADGLKKSSNILTAKLAVKLGDKRLYDYMRAFGLGQKTGVDLPGEEGGILRPRSDWSMISSTRMAIGQGVAVTALQMVALYGAIANNGVLMRPFLVRSVVAPDGTVLQERHPEEVGRPISEKTAVLMRHLLARVTEDGGTGKRARIEGYTIAGKTGTAQKAVAGGYSSTAMVASFVGFLPANDPEIAIVVVVDEPQPLHTGGVVAAPVFARIAGETARYLDLRPDAETAVAMQDDSRTNGAQSRP